MRLRLESVSGTATCNRQNGNHLTTSSITIGSLSTDPTSAPPPPCLLLLSTTLLRHETSKTFAVDYDLDVTTLFSPTKMPRSHNTTQGATEKPRKKAVTILFALVFPCTAILPLSLLKHYTSFFLIYHANLVYARSIYLMKLAYFEFQRRDGSTT